MTEHDRDEWASMRDRGHPSEAQWSEIRRAFPRGSLATGAVLSHHPFGFFVDLGGLATGLVEIPMVRDRGEQVSPDDYPAVGHRVTAVVLGGNDLQRQIHLSTAPRDLQAANRAQGAIS